MNARSLLAGVLNSVILVYPLAHAALAHCAEIASDQRTSPIPLAAAAPSRAGINQAITTEAVIAPLPPPSLPELAPSPESEDDTQPDGKTHAAIAAVADGVTTGMALSAGAIESNPLVATSPVGLVAVTGLKLGLVNYADTLPEQEKRFALKSTSAVWGGAAVNNIMVFLAAPPPVPILAGLVTGILAWKHLEGKYEEEDIRLAAKNSKLATSKTETTAKEAEVIGTSGE